MLCIYLFGSVERSNDVSFLVNAHTSEEYTCWRFISSFSISFQQCCMVLRPFFLLPGEAWHWVQSVLGKSGFFRRILTNVLSLEEFFTFLFNFIDSAEVNSMRRFNDFWGVSVINDIECTFCGGWMLVLILLYCSSER